VKMKLERLRQQVPDPYKAAVVGGQSAPSQAEAAADAQRAKLDEAIGWNNRLEGHLRDAESARATLQKAQEEYVQKALKLADDASTERAARVKAENALHWYRWHWWGSWIALGLGVLACVVFALLKATGKLAFL
jgi:signal transduction protein with GAF and PtsI domain